MAALAQKEIRAIIELCVVLWKTPTETMKMMKIAYRSLNVSLSHILWHKRFSEGASKRWNLERTEMNSKRLDSSRRKKTTCWLLHFNTRMSYGSYPFNLEKLVAGDKGLCALGEEITKRTDLQCKLSTSKRLRDAVAVLWYHRTYQLKMVALAYRLNISYSNLTHIQKNA